MNNLDQYSENLKQIEKGIWGPRRSITKISYPSTGNEECAEIESNSFWFEHRNKCIYFMVKKLPPEGVIFDIGGGNGFVSVYLQKKGFDTVLVEPGIEGARNAKRKGLKSIICSTLEDVDFREKSLPSVALFDVIEHIEDDHKFIKKIKYLLVKSGRLYITVPAYSWLWSPEDVRAGHYRRYTKKQLIALLVKLGYKIEYCTYIFSPLPFPIFLLRALPALLGLRRRVSAQDLKRDSKQKGSFNSILKWFLDKEIKQIRKLKQNRLGSSILVVARKV